MERASFIVPARDRNPGIRVHSRAETPESTRRLKRAGADHVITTYYTGAVRLAMSVLRPNLVDFLEIAHARFGPEIALEEVRVEQGCEMIGESVGQLETPPRRLRVVALRRGDDVPPIIPDDDTRVAGGDRLILIGERDLLDSLAERASQPRA